MERVETFFNERMRTLSIAPQIDNIILLKSSYKRKAPYIYGRDLYKIQHELDILPRKKYTDVKKLINDCLPNFDY